MPHIPWKQRGRRHGRAVQVDIERAFPLNGKGEPERCSQLQSDLALHDEGIMMIGSTLSSVRVCAGPRMAFL